MTSVQNHLQPSSGNNILKNTLIAISAAVVLGAASCSPKTTVLRNPNVPGNVGKTEEIIPDVADKEKDKAREMLLAKERNIALLLPFQLDLIAGNDVQEKDVKRSALALDFYQGFQLGLEEVARKGKPFRLKVIDSKDNPTYNASLASAEDVSQAGIVVGPVYPQEIRAFGRNIVDENKWIVNPLAASPASDFNISNLITVTPSIYAHMEAVATKVAEEYKIGDVVIIYQTTDSDSKQFLTGMATAIREKKYNAHVVTVSSLAQLNEKLTQAGNNIIISGTTDKTSLNNLISALTKKKSEYYSIRLFGHPLWDRFDFSNHPSFSGLNPTISTESNLKPWTSAVRQFRELYRQKYGVMPSDQSYKGYDVAVFFGTLINKYGLENLKAKLETETYNGIYNTYKFTYNETWGFANMAVSFKEYIHGSFQLQ